MPWFVGKNHTEFKKIPPVSQLLYSLDSENGPWDGKMSFRLICGWDSEREKKENWMGDVCALPWEKMEKPQRGNCSQTTLTGRSAMNHLTISLDNKTMFICNKAEPKGFCPCYTWGYFNVTPLVCNLNRVRVYTITSLSIYLFIHLWRKFVVIVGAWCRHILPPVGILV